MRKYFIIGAMLIAIAYVAGAGVEGSQQAFATSERRGAVPIPTRIGEQLWIAGSELVGRSGRPDAYRFEILGGSFQEHFEKEFDIPSPDCLHVSGGTYGATRMPTRFDELVTEAVAIIHGKVTGAAGGFYRLTGGLMVQVEVIGWIK